MINYAEAEAFRNDPELQEWRQSLIDKRERLYARNDRPLFVFEGAQVPPGSGNVLIPGARYVSGGATVNTQEPIATGPEFRGCGPLAGKGFWLWERG